MRIRNLLIHRATLLIPGQEIGRDAYNRPIFSEPTTKVIRCRLDQMSLTTYTDENGRDVVLSYVLFTGPENRIDSDMQIMDVVDEKNEVVVDGTFTIESIHPAYGRRNLHHYEVQLSRGDVNYE